MDLDYDTECYPILQKSLPADPQAHFSNSIETVQRNINYITCLDVAKAIFRTTSEQSIQPSTFTGEKIKANQFAASPFEAFVVQFTGRNPENLPSRLELFAVWLDLGDGGRLGILQRTKQHDSANYELQVSVDCQHTRENTIRGSLRVLVRLDSQLKDKIQVNALLKENNQVLRWLTGAEQVPVASLDREVQQCGAMDQHQLKLLTRFWWRLGWIAANGGPGCGKSEVPIVYIIKLFAVTNQTPLRDLPVIMSASDTRQIRIGVCAATNASVVRIANRINTALFDHFYTAFPSHCDRQEIISLMRKSGSTSFPLVIVGQDELVTAHPFHIDNIIDAIWENECRATKRGQQTPRKLRRIAVLENAQVLCSTVGHMGPDGYSNSWSQFRPHSIILDEAGMVDLRLVWRIIAMNALQVIISGGRLLSSY